MQEVTLHFILPTISASLKKNVGKNHEVVSTVAQLISLKSWSYNCIQGLGRAISRSNFLGALQVSRWGCSVLLAHINLPRQKCSHYYCTLWVGKPTLTDTAPKNTGLITYLILGDEHPLKHKTTLLKPPYAATASSISELTPLTT